MLSNLDDQRAVWLQIRVFRWGGSRGQREEGGASQNPPMVTEAKGAGYLESAAGPDQKPDAVGVAATSNQSVVPLHLGEAERGSTGTRRVASAASETRAVAPWVPPGAAPGRLEPGGGGDLLGGPQPRRGEGQPAAREERAAAPLRVATESGGEREQAGPPLVEESPGKGGRCSADKDSEESTDEGGPQSARGIPPLPLGIAPPPPRGATLLPGVTPLAAGTTPPRGATLPRGGATLGPGGALLPLRGPSPRFFGKIKENRDLLRLI